MNLILITIHYAIQCPAELWRYCPVPFFDFYSSISSMLSFEKLLSKCADWKWWPNASSKWWNKIHCRIVKKSYSIYNLLVVPMFLIINKVRRPLMRTQKHSELIIFDLSLDSQFSQLAEWPLERLKLLRTLSTRWWANHRNRVETIRNRIRNIRWTRWSGRW